MRKVKNIFIIGLFLFLVVLPCNGFTFPLEERVLLFDMGDGGSRFYRIPGIVTAADGSLVVVADRRWDKINDLPAHIDVVSRRSEDNGKTWSETVTIAGEEIRLLYWIRGPDIYFVFLLPVMDYGNRGRII